MLMYVSSYYHVKLPTRVKGARTHESRPVQRETPQGCENHIAVLNFKRRISSSISAYKPTCYFSKHGFC